MNATAFIIVIDVWNYSITHALENTRNTYLKSYLNNAIKKIHNCFNEKKNFK